MVGRKILYLLWLKNVWVNSEVTNKTKGLRSFFRVANVADWLHAEAFLWLALELIVNDELDLALVAFVHIIAGYDDVVPPFLQ